jgi:hypothetical protein
MRTRSRRGPGIGSVSVRLASILALVALAGCYTVRSSVPGHIKTIAVPVFRNESLQSGVDDEVTRAVIDRFQRNNALQVAEPAAANALLEGTIKSYENRVFRFDEREQAQEYVVTLTADVVVRDLFKNRELWTQEGIRTSATYAVSGPTERSEAEARQEAVEQLAEILLSRTVEGW